MNAAVVQSFDAPPRYAPFADPVAAEGEAMVNVTAAGLHPIVKSLANGTHYGSAGVLPFVPGVDGVGRLEDGCRVYFGARSPFGSFAERTVAPRAFTFPLADGLEDAVAAGIANPGMSSWAALKLRAQFAAGESALILGATGVAGRLAIQIAKRFGARRVVAAGREPEILARLGALGADAVISLSQEPDALIAAFRKEWAAGKIDVVLDYLRGFPAERLFEAISQKGLEHAASRVRYIQIGSSAGRTISLAAETLRSSGLELLGSGFGSVPIARILESIAGFFAEAAKKLFVFDVKTAPLRDVEALWNSSEPGTRLVFTVK